METNNWKTPKHSANSDNTPFYVLPFYVELQDGNKELKNAKALRNQR
jgi:hypothetical protein